VEQFGGYDGWHAGGVCVGICVGCYGGCCGIGGVVHDWWLEGHGGVTWRCGCCVNGRYKTQRRWRLA